MNCCSASVILNNKNNYICEIHFQKKDVGKKFLRKNALPMLFLDLPKGNSISPTPAFDPEKANKT